MSEYVYRFFLQNFQLLKMFPIWITNSKFAQYMEWDGFCAFVIIFFAEKKPERETIRHEMIHFHQYKEMLIIPFIITYLTFFLYGLMVYQDCDKAYRRIPFEVEADANENTNNYLKQRKAFAWINYIGKEILEDS
eukprot:201367_1